MEEYIIFTDSSCDLSAQMASEFELEVLPLSVRLKEREYKNYLDEREMKISWFYNQMREGGVAVTSAANVDAFSSVMKAVLQDGKDILYIGFSSALSSTYQNGQIAATELQEEFPDRKIICVDSKCASLGQGLLVDLAVKAKRSGKTLEECAKIIEDAKLNVCHWFTVDDLVYLKRGGRVSATTAAIGSLLQIKPVMHVDNDGRLVAVSKVRGRKNSIKSLFEKVKTTNYGLENQTVYISHGDCLDDANYLADMIRTLNPMRIVINNVGPVIGAHSGPGTLAVFFLGYTR